MPVDGGAPSVLLTPRSVATDFEWTTPQSANYFPVECYSESDTWASSSALPNSPAPPLPTRSYLAATELQDGRLSLLLDLGSVGNLASTDWVRRVAVEAMKHGYHSRQAKRDKPLVVGGVGKGTRSVLTTARYPLHFSLQKVPRFWARFQHPQSTVHPM